ncbi:B12-binding domain-containing radical SAM protein [Xanthomonas graminis]|uniref:B12-binding domain-containing radical SAM protein n=1 Tax=Xanthomonas graminis TaxID=3390026 RepID=UPI001F02F8C5|nr:radical SAM protein [Xanthomonas translucens]UKE73361.1 radical SAM protein [Xanthomonas translucens pv. phleipratensis]
MLNDFDGVDGFGRFVRYARELSPTTKLATFGRASRDIPEFFDRFELDAIGTAGDYEATALDFLRYIEEAPAAPGLRIRDANGYTTIAGPIAWLTADEWALPDVREIPYHAYGMLYANDLNKFCGIPARKELVVPVARGCPVGCSFCDVPRQQGLRERRLSVARVVEYIASNFRPNGFEYVSFYAPTFTLKRNWVRELCASLKDSDLTVPWKCVTTMTHLDDALLGEMASAGCIRVSVGVETFADSAKASLPVLKRDSRSRFLDLARSCQDVGIELNCFVMFGLPGESAESAVGTYRTLSAEGHRVRPTVYTPYEAMTGCMSIEEFSTFNRQLLLPTAAAGRDERAAFYSALYSNDFDRTTDVHHKIPLAAKASTQ